MKTNNLDFLDNSKAIIKKQGRTIYFFDEVYDEAVCDAIVALDELETKSKAPITFVISTSGGSCYDGLALYDRLRSSKCKINIVGTGMVASMGVILFIAGDTRKLTENACLLNHQMSTNTTGRMEDVKIELKASEALEQRMLAILSERTNLSIPELEKSIKLGDNYVYPEDAVKQGFATGIIKNKKVTNKGKSK